MNDKEWIKTALAHEDCPVPYNLPFSPVPQRKLEEYAGTKNIADWMGLPCRFISLKSIKPLYADPAVFGPTAKDEWGVVWSTNAIDRGSPDGHPLLELDLSGYTFPDPTPEYRFEDIGPFCEKNKDHYRIVFTGDLWERATFMRGMEPLLYDIVDNPDFVHALLRGIADYVLAMMTTLFSRFDFEALAISDDYGTQRGLLMSPASWREFVKPVLAEVYGLAKKHNRRVFHHTCGNVVPIIPDLIEIGMDILHPIQPEAMDVVALKREFGRDLTFCGGVRTQDLLPYGTPEDVKREVRWLKKELGKGGGYILEPGITIQADVPLENILALIEEARA